ncbi:8350_t:CDS:10 [Acaulospora morrowiae]|uniref:8350_t:CDS:1 n=1 Tax=Acaulospora morrowiae TaxID=94023 RepID=A0A9N9A2Z7_9GLOM|nr:8350_t:CDS:10 [Acaulospora morrowiae]
MSFGSELRDQVATVNQFVSNGIQFLNEVRDFVKERAQIEKEYASKIDALAKKHLSKRDKKEVTMSVGEIANTLSEKEFYSAKSEPSTFIKAWTAILVETENLAKERNKFSESVLTGVTEQVKTVASKKEDIRKKHMSFYQQLTSDKEKIYSEVQKAKSRYDESCLEAQSSHQKQERAPDEKLLDKLRKQASDSNIEMNNNKQLQQLNESKTIALRNIWSGYVDLELSSLNESKSHLELALKVIEDIDTRADSQLFIKYNKKKWEEPPDFEFKPSPTFQDNDEMADDENSRVFLSNKLLKSKQKLSELISEVEPKKKEIEGLESLKHAYEDNIKLGDPDVVTDKLHDVIHKVIILENSLTSYQTEIDTIVGIIGDGESEHKMHDFKNAAFTIPTTCDLCQSTIWGIAKQGFNCKDCGYNCHAKCEMKVPPNCTKKKGSIKRGTIYDVTDQISPGGTRSGTNSYKNGGSRSPTVYSSSTNEKEDVETWSATVLYDYDADGSTELSVSSGDIITVIKQDDGSGWVMATHNGKSGFVPASYIEYGDYVLYDYKARSPEELTIKEGDVIDVTNRDVGGGWWEGTLNGKQGQFPANYVTALE